MLRYKYEKKIGEKMLAVPRIMKHMALYTVTKPNFLYYCGLVCFEYILVTNPPSLLYWDFPQDDVHPRPVGTLSASVTRTDSNSF